MKITCAFAFLTALAIGGCSASGPTVAEHRRSGDEQLRAAEQSFSSIPFGTREPPKALTLVEDGGCVDGKGECTYIDASDVEHYFTEGELVVKSLQIGRVGARPIVALGIGTARRLDEVVKRVKRFLPEAEVDCDDRPAADGITCSARLGEGWFKLFFDDSRRLKEVRIDAYQFT